MLGYFAANSDSFITGRFLGATTLGFYNFAYQIPHLAETHIAPVVNQVLFPVLSQVQDDRERLRQGYLQSLRWIAVATLPFAVGLLVIAPEFVPVVYGEPWRPVILPLQILCLSGLAHALTNSVWTVQQAVGRPEIGLWWGAALVPITIGTLIFSLRWGMVGIATAMLFLSVGSSLGIQAVTNRLIALSWGRWFKVIRIPITAAVAMGLVSALWRAMMLAESFQAWMTLGTTVAVGIMSYVAGLLWMDRTLVDELRSLMPWTSGSARAAGAVDVTATVSRRLEIPLDAAER